MCGKRGLWVACFLLDKENEEPMPVTGPRRDAIEKSLSGDRKNLRMLLGDIIRVRMEAEDYQCHLLSLLVNDRRETLTWYEQKCSDYVQAVQNSEKAISKVREELMGAARNCSRYDFNSKLADFFAEIAAVGALSKQGGVDFEPLLPQKIKKGHTQGEPDFKFRLRDGEGNMADAYLEVKNIRAPIGILDSFHRAYSELSCDCPVLLHRFIRLAYYCDNRAEDTWQRLIEDFVLKLASGSRPFSTTLTLWSDVLVDVDVSIVEGNGGIALVRGRGADEGTFIDLEALRGKATCTVAKAIQQLSPYKDAKRIVALNISTADALLHESIIELLTDVVRAQGEGNVDLFLMHHHCAVDMNILATG